MAQEPRRRRERGGCRTYAAEAKKRADASYSLHSVIIAKETKQLFAAMYELLTLQHTRLQALCFFRQCYRVQTTGSRPWLQCREREHTGEHTYIMGPRKRRVKGLLLRKNERADESSPISYLILAPEGKVKESEGKAASGQSVWNICRRKKSGMHKVVVV